MAVLITGVAGFIGCHLAQRLLETDIEVIGVDNNTGTSLEMSKARIASLKKYRNFLFIPENISKYDFITSLEKFAPFTSIFHLAAKGNVRESLRNPAPYMRDNVSAFSNILEFVRLFPPEHFLYASTSAVYGNGPEFPSQEDMLTDIPTSFYAATKKSNEILAFSYANNYKIPMTGLRFFTVYGPWGRPDMALSVWARAMRAWVPLKLHNNGENYRDFTYIDDVIECLFTLFKSPPHKKYQEFCHIDDSESYHCILNIGSGRSIPVPEFLKCLEKGLGISAKIVLSPAQKTNVKRSHADVTRLRKITGYCPSTPIAEGVMKFAKWYKGYHPS
jgi:UDP-glucuronate 4-epimerase